MISEWSLKEAVLLEEVKVIYFSVAWVIQIVIFASRFIMSGVIFYFRI